MESYIVLTIGIVIIIVSTVYSLKFEQNRTLKRKKYRRVTKNGAEEIKKLRGMKVPVDAIAEIMDVSPATVYRHLKD
jgi:IS30 family transposase